ncbi:MAG: TIGR00341 family protein [Chromatiaceae bacterium]
MRIVEVIADAKHSNTLAAMARFYGALDFWRGSDDGAGRHSVRMLVPDEARQSLTDSLQNLLEGDSAARIVILPVDAVLPRPQPRPEDEERRKKQAVAATREELYEEIARGAKLDSNFLLLTLLSTVAAAIGLAEDSVAAVIGAMVIAPLLGPNIAFAFATSLGDKTLLWQALRTNAAGLGLALALSIGISLIWPVNLNSSEVLARTVVGLDDVALALASGAAAVLSLTTGLSSTLVGVMVAVALLPPTAVLGMLIGAGRWDPAAGAALLLAVNLVCVVLSAKVVFLVKGVKPRDWTERNRARQSMAAYLSFWALLLSILVAVILARSTRLL